MIEFLEECLVDYFKSLLQILYINFVFLFQGLRTDSVAMFALILPLPFLNVTVLCQHLPTASLRYGYNF